MISYAYPSKKTSIHVSSHSVDSSRRNSVSSISQPLLRKSSSESGNKNSTSNGGYTKTHRKSYTTTTYSPFDPDPPAPSSSASSLRRSSSVGSANLSSSSSSNRVHRPVTRDMIEVVQAMAPNLSSAQIIYDLQRTGSVELTMRRYITKGNRLPHPPREAHTSVRSSNIYNPDNYAPNTYPGFCNSVRKFRDDHRRAPSREL